MKSILDDLGITAQKERSTYEPMTLTIVKVGVVSAKQLEITEPKDGNKYFALELKTPSGDTFKVRQILWWGRKKINGKFEIDKTKVTSPISKAYYRNDGTYAPSSLAYDISKAIEKELSEIGLQAWSLLAWDDAEKWVGMHFTIGVKSGERKDGTGRWYMLQTDEQKYYDRMSARHYAATNEWVSDKAILREMDKGGYSPEVPDEERAEIDVNKVAEVIKSPEAMTEFADTVPQKESKKKTVATDPDVPF